jgi:hypothetical protein
LAAAMTPLWRAQNLGFEPRLANDIATATKSFKFDLGFDHQALQGDAAFRKYAKPFELRFRDRNDLIDLARLFRECGAVGLR